MECYKYSTLATQPSAADSGSKKLTADWSVVVGEQAVEVIVSAYRKLLPHRSIAAPPQPACCARVVYLRASPVLCARPVPSRAVSALAPQIHTPHSLALAPSPATFIRPVYPASLPGGHPSPGRALLALLVRVGQRPAAETP